MELLYYGLGAVAVLGAGVGGFFFWRSRQPKEDPVYYYYCQGCKRKLRYQARQINRPGMCPICKKRFVFPEPRPS